MLGVEAALKKKIESLKSRIKELEEALVEHHTCVNCKCLLHVETPPHCEDCSLTDDNGGEFDWPPLVIRVFKRLGLTRIYGG